jgi:hypothetical protein
MRRKIHEGSDDFRKKTLENPVKLQNPEALRKGDFHLKGSEEIKDLKCVCVKIILRDNTDKEEMQRIAEILEV